MLKTILGFIFVGILITFTVIVCVIGHKDSKPEENNE